MNSSKKCNHNPLLTIDYEFDDIKLYQCPLCGKFFHNINVDDKDVIEVYDFAINNDSFICLLNELIEYAVANNINVNEFLMSNSKLIYQASVPSIVRNARKRIHHNI